MPDSLGISTLAEAQQGPAGPPGIRALNDPILQPAQPSYIQQLAAEEQLYAAEAAQRKAQEDEQLRLEREHGILGTVALQSGRGFLDFVTAGGALAGLGLETAGELTGADGLAKFGRDLGQSASGAAAIEAMSYMFGADAEDGLDNYEAVKRKMSEQDKAHPLLSMASRMAGISAAAIATGGLAAAPAAHGLTAAGLRTTGAIGAGEGAAFGAQGAYERSAPLRDVLTSTAIGAALGGLSNVGAELIGHFGKSLAMKATENMDLAKWSNRLAVKALGPDKRAMKELGKRVEQVGQDLKDLGIIKVGASMDDMLETALKHQGESGRAIGQNFFSKLDEMGARVEVKGLAEQIEAVAAKHEGSGLLASQNALSGKIRTEFANILNYLKPTGIIKRGGEEVERAPLLFSQLHQARVGLDDVINWASAAKDPLSRDLRAIRGIMERTIEEGADKAFAKAGLPEMVNGYQAAKRIYAASTWATDVLTDNLAKAQSTSALGLLDTLSGVGGIGLGMATGSVGWGLAGSLAAAGASKVVRKQGDAALSVVLGKIAESSLFGQGGAMSRLVLSKVGSQVEKVLPALRFTRSKTLEETAQHVAAHETQSIAKELYGATKRGSKLAVPAIAASLSAKEQSELYFERLDRVKQVVSSKDTSQVDAQLSRFPGMTVGLQTRINLDFQDKLVKLMNDLPKPGQDTRGRPRALSNNDIRKGNAMYEATVDPLSVFDDFASGVIDYDKVKYAWEQNPGLQHAAQLGVADLLYTQLEPEELAHVTDSALTQLDFLLDMNGTLQPTVAPDFLRTMEGIFMEEQAQKPEPPAPSGGNLDLPTAQPTFTQRISGATQ